MFSKAIVLGRIASDLELRVTSGNLSVLSFRIAVNRKMITKDGERLTDFFNVVAWRSTAEFIDKYFKKGSLILIDGRFETREYIDKNGLNQRVVEIIAEHASFTGENQKKEENVANDYATLAEELSNDEGLPF